MWDCHELGERRMTQNGVVGPIKVDDHEVDEFCAKVVWCSELDRQRYLAKGY